MFLRHIATYLIRIAQPDWGSCFLWILPASAAAGGRKARCTPDLLQHLEIWNKGRYIHGWLVICISIVNGLLSIKCLERQWN